ncbi:PfkB family carbohydrate kinase [Mucilaginibacter sp. UC70_90]
MGSATRLSPEAPVPIVNVKNETTTLGGAGNVVQNLVSLGAKVIVAGVIGNDQAAGELIKILTDEGVETDSIIKDSNRPTTVKPAWLLAATNWYVLTAKLLTKYRSLLPMSLLVS